MAASASVAGHGQRGAPSSLSPHISPTSSHIHEGDLHHRSSEFIDLLVAQSAPKIAAMVLSELQRTLGLSAGQGQELGLSQGQEQGQEEKREGSQEREESSIGAKQSRGQGQGPGQGLGPGSVGRVTRASLPAHQWRSVCAMLQLHGHGRRPHYPPPSHAYSWEEDKATTATPAPGEIHS